MEDTAKSKSQGTQTGSTSFSFWLDPAYLEYVWPGLLVLVFLVLMWIRSRRAWMLVDAVALVACGLALLFVPENLFSYLMADQVKSDGFFTAQCGILASVALGSGLVWFFLRNSTDNYTQVMLLGTRAVGTSAMQITMYVLHRQDKIFTDQYFRLWSLDCLLWMLGSIYFFVSAKNYGGHSQLDSWLNFHLRIDFFMTLMFGLVWYAYPKFIMNMHSTGVNPANVHTLMGQVIGSIMIGSAILSAVAPGFLFNEDKRNILLCRIVTIILILVTALSALDHSTIDKDVMVSHLVGVVWIVNAALGYFAPHETDGYWSGRNSAAKKE